MCKSFLTSDRIGTPNEQLGKDAIRIGETEQKIKIYFPKNGKAREKSSIRTICTCLYHEESGKKPAKVYKIDI